MADQVREHAHGGLRLALVAVTLVEFVVAAAALWAAWHGAGPVLSVRVQRILAYAWIALTIAAALGAYGLAYAVPGNGAPRRPRSTLAGAALAAFAALAGIAIFWLVAVWPMLIVSLLVGLLGLVLGWPATSVPSVSASPPVAAEADASR